MTKIVKLNSDFVNLCIDQYEQAIKTASAKHMPFNITINEWIKTWVDNNSIDKIHDNWVITWIDRSNGYVDGNIMPVPYVYRFDAIGYLNGNDPPKRNGSYVIRPRPTLRKAVQGVHIKTGHVLNYPSATAAVADGFSQGNICNCANGRAKSHRGYKWKFV